MIFSENRRPPPIKSGAGFFGIMLERVRRNPAASGCGAYRAANRGGRRPQCMSCIFMAPPAGAMGCIFIMPPAEGAGWDCTM